MESVGGDSEGELGAMVMMRVRWETGMVEIVRGKWKTWRMEKVDVNVRRG